MKTLGIIVGLIFVAVVIWRLLPDGNVSLGEYAGRAVIDVAADSAGAVITDVLETKNSNYLIAARLRINDLESQLQAEHERSRRLEAKSRQWNETETLFRSEIDDLKERNSIQWDHINSIPVSTSRINPADCMPRTAAAYHWLSSGSYPDHDDSAIMRATGN